MRRSRIWRLLVIGTVAAAASAGCGGNASAPGEARFSVDIPLPPGVTYTTQMGGTSYGDAGEAHNSMAWFYDVDSTDRVVSFYRAKLEEAEVEEADDSVTFIFSPDDVSVVERVTVTVWLDERELQITESYASEGPE